MMQEAGEVMTAMIWDPAFFPESEYPGTSLHVSCMTAPQHCCTMRVYSRR